MGRQAYLAKIAFGRSAFESTQAATQSTEYLQLESSQSELPRQYQDATANNYIQLYDERGNPINPQAHAYGKQLRDAQNDVLASVGVLERKRAPTEGLPGSYGEQLGLLESEDNIGAAVGCATTLADKICTWWIASLRARLLTFRFDDTETFAHIIASERAISGLSFFYTGFPCYLFSTLGLQAFSFASDLYQPVDRMFRLMRPSTRKRPLIQWLRRAIHVGLQICPALLAYPCSYHSRLQILGLVPASPMLPSLNSLELFSDLLPQNALPSHHGAMDSATGVFKAVLTTPLVLLFADHLARRRIQSYLREAVESSIIRPDNADVPGRNLREKDRAILRGGPQRQLPHSIRDAINRLLSILGWSEADSAEDAKQDQLDTNDGATMDVGSTRIENVTQLDMPIVQTQNPTTGPLTPDVVTIPIDVIDEMIRPITPPTLTASASDHDDNDPRIRITSREGIVEMEDRLPSRILSTHSEVVDALPSSERLAATLRNTTLRRHSRSRHRVTVLSSEPAQLISGIVQAQLISLAMMPLRWATLRVIASHYLSRHGGQAELSHLIRPVPDLYDVSWRTVGIQTSRLAMCAALDLSIELSLWGLQYITITHLGRRRFGWGTL